MIVFDDLISVMLSNKSLNPIVTELSIWGRKLNVSLAFITQSYFAVRKDIRLNSTHYFIMKISSKRGFQQMTLNQSSNIGYETLQIFTKKCIAKSYSFLVIDTTLASDNPLRFKII